MFFWELSQRKFPRLQMASVGKVDAITIRMPTRDVTVLLHTREANEIKNLMSDSDYKKITRQSSLF